MKKFLMILVMSTISMHVSANLVFTNGQVTFGGVAPAYDGSKLTSSLLAGYNANHLAGATLYGIDNTGLFVETFDQATQLGTTGSVFGAGTTAYNSNIGNNSGCAVNGTGSGVGVSGSFNVREGDVGGLAIIGYDDNCYGYTPEDRVSSGNVTIDFQPILDLAASEFGYGVGMDYLGFYWATIDTYNTFTFRNDGIEVMSFNGAQLIGELDDLNLGTTGQYINVYFNSGIYFDELFVESTTRAAEFDNIVNRIVPVSEPAALALLMLSFAGLVIRRRQKQIQ